MQIVLDLIASILKVRLVGTHTGYLWGVGGLSVKPETQTVSPVVHNFRADLQLLVEKLATRCHYHVCLHIK